MINDYEMDPSGLSSVFTFFCKNCFEPEASAFHVFKQSMQGRRSFLLSINLWLTQSSS